MVLDKILQARAAAFPIKEIERLQGDTMSIFTAHYDPVSDKILGCEPDTISYYHEEGHQKWYKEGVESTIELWQQFCMWTALIFLAWDNNHIPKISITLFILLLMVSEVHAWIFAFNKWRKTR
jgi:hypothetical protein